MSLCSQVLAMGFVGVVFVAGPVPGAPAGQETAASATAKVDDTTLRSRIVASLEKNATLAARRVDVEVHEGIVTLKGVVGTAAEKTRAARLATIKGVTEVRNQIVVDAAAAKRSTGKAIDGTARAAEKSAGVTTDAARTTGDKTKEMVGTAGEKTKQVALATGEVITDSWITTKVKAKFFDETLLNGSDIHVETTDRVVTLTGSVTSSAAKARAEAIAGGTEGVTRVVNQLVVKGK